MSNTSNRIAWRVATSTEFDPLGRIVAVDGDQYPLRADYDTAGRKTCSRTTRDGGAAWDITCWMFDPLSGLNTSKRYADGSHVDYTYTDNGRQRRTTWARGVWREHAYNDRNLVSGTYLTNTVYALPNGNRFCVKLQRDPGRRNLITRRDHTFNGNSVYWYSTDFDLLARPTNAVDSISIARTYFYNRRSELAAAQIGTNSYGYAYDSIGNRTADMFNGMSRSYTANILNQYTAVNRTIEQSEQSNNLAHDADGNLVSCGPWSYTYDSANRLVSISSNGVMLVTNYYDARDRRVKKVTQSGTFTFFYDDWNLVEERVVSYDAP